MSERERERESRALQWSVSDVSELAAVLEVRLPLMWLRACLCFLAFLVDKADVCVYVCVCVSSLAAY